MAGVFDSSSSSSDRCPKCGHRVFHAERMVIGGLTFHKACFTCRVCKVHLDSLNANCRDSQLYCRKCYGRAYGPRGYGFGMGAGTLSMTLTAMQDPRLDAVLHKPGTVADTMWRDDLERRANPYEENPLQRRYVKAYPHDQVVTSNVPYTGEAHAFPRLLQDQHEVKQRVRVNFAPAAANLAPNVVSLTPATAFWAGAGAAAGTGTRGGGRHQLAADTFGPPRRSSDQQQQRRQLRDEPEAFLVRASR